MGQPKSSIATPTVVGSQQPSQPPFGQTSAAPSGVFGQSAPQSFGQVTPSQATAQASGLFSQPPPTQKAGTSAPSFGQPGGQAASQQQSGFGSVTQVGVSFGAHSASQTASGLFEQAAATTQAPAPFGLSGTLGFGASAQQTGQPGQTGQAAGPMVGGFVQREWCPAGKTCRDLRIDDKVICLEYSNE